MPRASASVGVQHDLGMRLRRVLAALVGERGVEEEVRLGRHEREREATGQLLVGHLGRRHVVGMKLELAGLGDEVAVGVRRLALAEVDLGPAPLAEAVAREVLQQLLHQLLVGVGEAGVRQAEALGQQPEGLRVRLRLPQRLDRGLVPGHVVMAPGEEHVQVLELRGGRQHHVGMGRGVGHELLEHDREEVLPAEAFEHPLLIRGDVGRVGVPAHERPAPAGRATGR